MFRIKICGVTRPEDAAHAVACGAEAIGINFFPGSPRFVPADRAREIVEAVADRAEVVGVFVNEAPETILALCGRLGIRRVQLHGDEPPGDASRIPLWRIKAVHADLPADLPALLAYPCEAFLLDAGGGGAYGGTGRELAWGELGDRLPGIADARKFYTDAKQKHDLLVNLEHNDADLKEKIAAAEKLVPTGNISA